jgi:BASS family bile acid:Na+ symporter
MNEIDALKITFDAQSLKIMNFAIAFVMLGVALDMKFEDFKRICYSPKGPVIGLICQFLILPAVAFGIISVLNPQPSIGLGILLVSCCPGGNLSNFLTKVAGGNTALSVTMSSVSTMLSVIMTPLNFTFWASQHEGMNALVQSISINPFEMFKTIMLILIVPTIIGMLIASKFENVKEKLTKVCNIFSTVLFAAIIVGGLYKNAPYIKYLFSSAILIVFLTNSAGLLLGYNMARLAGLPKRDAKAVSIEVGIQNAGFGLILIFNFFGGLGGMALITACWGIWHMISGSILALYWGRSNAREKNKLPLGVME